MAYLNTTLTNGSPVFARTRAAFRGLATRIKQQRDYRETFQGLSALSNRELTDLGLNRSELRFVAREASRR